MENVILVLVFLIAITFTEAILDLSKAAMLLPFFSSGNGNEGGIETKFNWKNPEVVRRLDESGFGTA